MEKFIKKLGKFWGITFCGLLFLLIAGILLGWIGLAADLHCSDILWEQVIGYSMLGILFGGITVYAAFEIYKNFDN